MAQRLRNQGAHARTIVTIPPWSPDEELAPVPRAANSFRALHDLVDATVVMYSGNHSPSNPLTALLDAAVVLKDVPNLRFVFIGNGTAKQQVEEYVTAHSLTNILTLPYQPQSSLSTSLSAADVHLVSLGANMAGIIHPCKVYGAMAVGRPIIYFGPSPSHVTSILEAQHNGWSIGHGDVPGAVAVLSQIAATRHDTLDSMGQRGRSAMDSIYRPTLLCAAVAEAIERGLSARSIH